MCRDDHPASPKDPAPGPVDGRRGSAGVARYGALDVLDRGVVIFDRQNTAAWRQSDHVVTLGGTGR